MMIIPSRNEDSQKLQSIFFQYRNDIDIFTEDENKCKEFYSTLFKRLFRDTDLNINDITPLGNKRNVLNQFLNDSSSRKRLYIVDGDIDTIQNQSIISNKRLLVLDSYNIENLIFDEESTTQYLYYLLGTTDIATIKSTFKFNDWLEEYTDSFIELFFHFSILYQKTGMFELHNAKFFHKHDTGVFKICQNTVDKKIQELKHKILNNSSEEEYTQLISERRIKWPKNTDTLLRIVSGKDYLIQMLEIKLNKHKERGRINLQLDPVKLFLANHCKLDRLQQIKNAVLSL